MAEAKAIFKPIGRRFWDITPVFNLEPPKPAKPIKCPICGDTTFYFKDFRLFQRWGNNPNLPEELKEQFRADIAVKCNNCGYVPSFGVHLTRREFYELIEIFNSHGIYNNILDYTTVGHWLISPKYEKQR